MVTGVRKFSLYVAHFEAYTQTHTCSRWGAEFYQRSRICLFIVIVGLRMQCCVAKIDSCTFQFSSYTFFFLRPGRLRSESEFDTESHGIQYQWALWYILWWVLYILATFQRRNTQQLQLGIYRIYRVAIMILLAGWLSDIKIENCYLLIVIICIQSDA